MPLSSAARQMMTKMSDMKKKYDEAYKKGEQRPGVQKAKSQMKYGARP